MKSLKVIAAAIALLMPIAAQAQPSLDYSAPGQPQVVEAWGAMCKRIYINGKMQWWCPNGAKVRDHRGCKQVAINGKWQEVCPRS